METVYSGMFRSDWLIGWARHWHFMCGSESNVAEKHRISATLYMVRIDVTGSSDTFVLFV